MGAELYSHAGDDGTDFDAFENVNQLEDFPQVASDLRDALRFLIDNQRLARPARTSSRASRLKLRRANALLESPWDAASPGRLIRSAERAARRIVGDPLKAHGRRGRHRHRHALSLRPSQGQLGPSQELVTDLYEADRDADNRTRRGTSAQRKRAALQRRHAKHNA